MNKRFKQNLNLIKFLLKIFKTSHLIFFGDKTSVYKNQPFLCREKKTHTIGNVSVS